MPFYDYKCPECNHEQEELRQSSDTTVVMCGNCGAPVKKVIKAGSGGFKMTTDSTRNRDYKTRYGGNTRKSDNTTTPSESAQLKAKEQMEERIAAKKAKKNPNDPYANFK